MNGWISILFSLMGGLALLMKNKTSENGGGDFTVVRNGDSTTPSHSGDEMSAKDITVLDVVDDPSLLDVLKITDPDKYEKITQTIWQNPSYLQRYVRTSKYTRGEWWVDIDNKEDEVMQVLEEGVLQPFYVGKSASGEYFIEVFVKEDPNIGWNGDGEKVGIVMYEIIRKFPDQPTRMIRDYQLADMDHFQYEGQIERFNNNYAAL